MNENGLFKDYNIQFFELSTRMASRFGIALCYTVVRLIEHWHACSEKQESNSSEAHSGICLTEAILYECKLQSNISVLPKLLSSLVARELKTDFEWF